MKRRAFVRGIGSLPVVGGLAGCAGGGGGGGSGATATPRPTPTPTSTSTATGTATPTAGGGDTSTVDSYLSDVSNYDGTVADRTGRSEVTVAVGAPGNGGAFAFDPPAVRVDVGTTVVWEWTGEGGLHNVVAAEGASFSSDLVSEAGYTFPHTFDAPGTVTYFCQPHRSLGMKGAVVVV